ncbi:MAG: hypothetical protein C0468_06265 [Planctomyces sp.]|nr:hypothetical protein [Planctomyces sp.]
MARGWSVWGWGGIGARSEAGGAGWAGPAPAGALLATAAVAVVFGSMVAAVRRQDVRGAAGAVAGSALAFVYAGMTIGFLMALRAEHSAWVMGGVIAVIKACDIGAYFAGTFFGRRKLIPWLSPGKTWEGLAGGVVASCVVAAGLVWVGGAMARGAGVTEAGARQGVAGVLGWPDALALGVCLAIAGQLGDLSASVLKRDAGVKDAGRIVPGFGGVIDVLDSLLIAGPIAFWYLAVRVWAA